MEDGKICVFKEDCECYDEGWVIKARVVLLKLILNDRNGKLIFLFSSSVMKFALEYKKCTCY